PGFALLLNGVRGLLGVNPLPQPPVPPPSLPLGLWTRAEHWHPAVTPTLLLAAVFVLNCIETAVDPWLTPSSLDADAGYPIADAFRWLERGLSFESHDTIGAVTVAGYSASYFAIFPLMCLFVAWHLARRSDSRPYRALSAAVAIDYFASLPF